MIQDWPYPEASERRVWLPAGSSALEWAVPVAAGQKGLRNRDEYLSHLVDRLQWQAQRDGLGLQDLLELLQRYLPEFLLHLPWQEQEELRPLLLALVNNPQVQERQEFVAGDYQFPLEFKPQELNQPEALAALQESSLEEFLEAVREGQPGDF